MTPQDFIRKWKPVALTERATAQEHFLDLCRLVDHPTPAEDDSAGERFTFEKGVSKTGGGDGFADVWKKDFFAWRDNCKAANWNSRIGRKRTSKVRKSDQPKEPQICFSWRNKCERGTQVLAHNKRHILEIFGGCF